MLDMVVWAKHQPASVKAIAQRQSIPAPYLEKLLIELRLAGLVQSMRGMHGGYVLSRSAKQISLGDILEAVGEHTDPLPRLEPNSEQADDWVTYALWQRLHQKVKDALYGISLEDLYYDARSWQAAQGQESGFTI
jgi:Rrf2 family protein